MMSLWLRHQIKSLKIHHRNDVTKIFHF